MSGLESFPAAPTPDELAKFPRNDLGNALRLARLVGGVIMPNGDIDHTNATLLYWRKRGWIAFNGKFWDLEAGEEEARRWAHRVAVSLINQRAPAIENNVPAKDWDDFAQKTGNSGASSSMLTQASSYLSVDLKAFDRDPLALNCANGTVKFSREAGSWVPTLHPFSAADRITRIASAAYDPKAVCPEFSALVAWTQPRRDMQAYLQAVFGYGVTGSQEEQLFVILQGKGGDGKSTLVNAVREAVGTYAFGAAIETFLDTGLRKSSEASPDLARLAGDTRLICTSEPPRGSKLAASAIKTFTGGGTIQARQLRQDIFEFTPKGKVVMECNSRPVINDTDDGIWRRVRIILFTRQIPEADQDKKLPDRLVLEAGGILNWLVGGIMAWLNDGLKSPEPVLEAVEDYRRGSNPFAEWMRDRLILDQLARTQSTAFYQDYKKWMDDQGHERPMSQTSFGRALGDLQILLAGKDGEGKKMRRGARLRETSDPDLVEGVASPGGTVAVGEDHVPPEGDWDGQ